MKGLRQRSGAVRREGEAAVGGGAAAGQVGRDLAGERSELGAVARAGRTDHERALPVQDEVLGRRRGVQAGQLADRVRIEILERVADERADRLSADRADDAVAAVSCGDRAVAVLTYLDRPGHLAVAPGQQTVEG